MVTRKNIWCTESGIFLLFLCRKHPSSQICWCLEFKQEHCWCSEKQKISCHGGTRDQKPKELAALGLHRGGALARGRHRIQLGAWAVHLRLATALHRGPPLPIPGTDLQSALLCSQVHSRWCDPQRPSERKVDPVSMTSFLICVMGDTVLLLGPPAGNVEYSLTHWGLTFKPTRKKKIKKIWLGRKSATLKGAC